MTIMRVDIPQDTLLEAVQNLSLDELNEFVHQVVLIRARKAAPSLSEQEELLLEQIYTSKLSDEKHARLLHLGAKCENETINYDERIEFTKLVEQSELLNAKRIEGVAKLAALKGTSLDAMMTQLDLWNKRV